MSADGLLLPAGVERLPTRELQPAGRSRLRLEVLRPAPGAPMPGTDAGEAAARPAVLWLHDGAWRWGNRLRHLEWTFALLEAGFVVASSDYRLTDEAVFPAQIHDAKCAVRHLRHHAASLGIDPDRIGVFGASAGGHLAALLGTSTGVTELEGDGGFAEASSAVQAVCAWFPITDFIRMDDFPAGVTPALEHRSARSPEGRLLGGALEERLEVAHQASPQSWLRPPLPPFLLMHGLADDAVPCGQSELLHAALVSAGARCELELLPGLDHAGEGWSGTPRERVTRFFRRHLGG